MSISDRRDSLRKSSIGIESIRKSLVSLREGLVAVGRNSRELLKETRKTNQYKQKLIRQDAEFFKRRRENALRKQREDELEASTITGVTKRQGSLVQKSTRGFLGRILDFIGILLLGWAITNLPKIIAAFQKLFGLIQRVVGVLTGFVEGIRNFLVGIGTGIDNFLDIFRRFNFAEDDKNIKDTFEEGQNNLQKLNKDFVDGAQLIANDEDIANAGQVAEDLGINDDSAPDVTGIADDITVPDDTDEEVETFSAEEVEILNQGGELPENLEAGFFTEPTEEDIERERALDAEEDAAENVQGVKTATDEETLEEVLNDAENVEGAGGGEEEAATPPAGSGANVTGIDPNFEGALQNKAEDFDYGDEKGKVDPVDSKDKSSSVTPVKKSRNNLQQRRRRRRTIVQVDNRSGGGSNTTPSSGGTNIKYVKVGNTSEKTLLDLQSLNNKQN
tara:strand:- start:122 stop:1462 length:1341 start_codon:yes stop_codon:yes gene_type:complete